MESSSSWSQREEVTRVSRSGRRLSTTQKVLAFVSPHQCKFCSRRFNTLHTLRKHVATCLSAANIALENRTANENTDYELSVNHSRCSVRFDEVTKMGRLNEEDEDTENKPGESDLVNQRTNAVLERKQEGGMKNHNETSDGKDDHGNIDLRTKILSLDEFVERDVSDDFFIIARSDLSREMLDVVERFTSDDYLVLPKTALEGVFRTIVNDKELSREKHECSADGESLGDTLVENDDQQNRSIKIEDEDTSTLSKDHCDGQIPVQRCENLTTNAQEVDEENGKIDGFTCGRCDRVFKSEKRFSTHMRGHESRFECPVCRKTYINFKLYQSHTACVHLEKNVICGVCFAKIRLPSLVPHFKRLHPDDEIKIATENELAESIVKINENLDHNYGTGLVENDNDIEKCDDTDKYERVDQEMSLDDDVGKLITKDTRSKCDNPWNKTEAGLKINICNACGAVFETEKELCVHYAVHYSDRPFFCTVCERQFKSQKYFENHKKLHGAKYKHGCPVCGKRFRDVRSVRSHLKQHDKSREYECDVCGKKFATEGQFKQHIVSHDVRRPFVCDYCGRGFKRKQTLNWHLKSDCKKKEDFIVRLTIEDHKEMDENDFVTGVEGKNTEHQSVVGDKIIAESSFEEVCLRDLGIFEGETVDKDISGNMYFDSLNQLQKIGEQSDVKVNTASSEGKYCCVVVDCGKRFNSSAELLSHLDEHKVPQPTNKVPYLCQVCGKAFRNKARLRVHLVIHSGEKPYKCDVCGQSFADRGNMSKHKRTHDNVRGAVCHLCGKAFKHNVALTTHLAIHRPDRPYKCEICAKGFKTRGNFQIHQKRHAKIKPHQCAFCEYACLEANKLKRHELRHTSDVVIRCDVCYKVFKDPVYLKAHSALHNTDRVFRCGICSKIFREKSKLQRHYKSHEGGKFVVQRGRPMLNRSQIGDNGAFLSQLRQVVQD